MCETLDEADSQVQMFAGVQPVNAWAMMDLQLTMFLSVSRTKFSTTIMPRIIALHGIDGSCSTKSSTGRSMRSVRRDDLWLMTVRRKNTSRFTMDGFIQSAQASAGLLRER